MLLSLIQGLRQLQQLKLSYNEPDAAAAHAQLWQQMPALRGLRLGRFRVTTTLLKRILQGLTAVNTLTELSIQAHLPLQATIHVCAALSDLCSLQSLQLVPEDGLRVPPEDALHLTSLTRLTELSLSGFKAGVGDYAASVLACSLLRLRHLDLEGCELGYCACLAPIARLIGLTHLGLSCNEGLTNQHLMRVTGLSRLVELGVQHGTSISSEGIDRFWTVMRHQQQQW